MERGYFGRMGVILATAGSAVGLGNVWRFPYMAGENGGAAFIVVYLGCVLLLGIPGMASEFVIGRHAQANAYRAYGSIGGSRWWKGVGVLGIVTGTIILGFYAVVAGWCLQYLAASLSGSLGSDAKAVQQYFAEFSSHPVQPCLWAIAFLLLTHVVIVRGVKSGIERASKVLMPLLLLLLVVIVAAAVTLPGAMEGVSFLLKPDFSKVSSSVLLEALGQAFFSLSLGTACLCTYASYFTRNTNLLRDATQIAFLDSAIAILAGLMIFPAAFAVGVKPDSGPSLIFITLPNVFQQAFAPMPAVGYAIAIMFYALLVFAALTSTISMHEIGTAFFHEELHLKRKHAAWVLTCTCSLIAIGCSLSVGACPQMTVLGRPLLDFCDQLTAQVMLPAGAFLTSILVGWFAKQSVVRSEITNNCDISDTIYAAWRFGVRFIVPLCILAIFLHQFGII